MDPSEQITLGQGIGRIEGTVNTFMGAAKEHFLRDDQRFDELWKRLDDIKDQRGEDIAAAHKNESEARKWRWTIFWTLGGTVGGVLLSATITVILKINHVL